MSDILLDTNIIIDFFETQREFHEDATKLIDQALAGGHTLYVAATTCKDSYYILTHLRGESEARQCIQAIFTSIELLPVDNRTCYDGFNSSEPDFEDGIIRSCAELNHLDYLVTRDSKAFKDSSVKALDPQAMLGILNGKTLSTRQPPS